MLNCKTVIVEVGECAEFAFTKINQILVTLISIVQIDNNKMLLELATSFLLL